MGLYPWIWLKLINNKPDLSGEMFIIFQYANFAADPDTNMYGVTLNLFYCNTEEIIKVF